MPEYPGYKTDDTEIEVDKELEKELQVLDNKQFSSLAKQIQYEFDLSYEHQQSKKATHYRRLQLYNNQKRADDVVGDTTIFQTFQTVFASLYTDRLTVNFNGRTYGDEERAENINAMADFDYEEMGKDEIDFDWIFDTLSFGYGLVEMSEFYRDPATMMYYPIPFNIDPLTFLRDPRCKSINGNKHRMGSARFCGYDMYMTMEEMKNHPHFISSVDDMSIKTSGEKSLLTDASEARDNALNFENRDKFADESKLNDNAEYPVTKWFTWFKVKGKLQRVKVWLINERKDIVGFEELKNQQAYPIFDRKLYPHSHDFDGTSLFDLLEDKQRLRAIALNLGIKAMMNDLYDSYFYDQNRITNKAELKKEGFRKFIPVDGPTQGAIEPMRKNAPNLNLLDFIYQSIDQSAQRATATPEIQQGVLSAQQRTLGEIDIAKAQSDTRYSLSAKVFGMSERNFWRQYYWMYKNYLGEGIDKKMVRLVSPFGPKWQPIMKKDIVAEIDYDVEVESKYNSEYKNMQDRVMQGNFFTMLLNTPEANRRAILKQMSKMYEVPKEMIDRLLPPTVDERIAESQNVMLSENQTVPVTREDDHNVHLEIHRMAVDTPATLAHIQTHVEALSIKKTNPDIFPQDIQANTAYQEKTMDTGNAGKVSLNLPQRQQLGGNVSVQ